MKTLTERCEIELQALALGECEYDNLSHGRRAWYSWSIDEKSIFDWQEFDYRIKPEPRVFYTIEDGIFIFDSVEEAERVIRAQRLDTKIIKLQEVL